MTIRGQSGAFILQKKLDGRTHPIHFDSLTMNDAARSYDTSEIESLSVEISSRVYLLSSLPFFILTNFQVLSYTFKNKDILIFIFRLMKFSEE